MKTCDNQPMSDAVQIALITSLTTGIPSIKDELVALTAKSAHAEGKLEGKAEEKAKNGEMH